MSKVSALALVGAVLSFAAHPASGQSAAPLPDGPGKETAEAFCNSCHTLMMANSLANAVSVAEIK